MDGDILPSPPTHHGVQVMYDKITLTTAPSQRCIAYRGVEVECHTLPSWRWDIIFMHWLLYVQGKWFWNPLNRRVGEPHSQSGHFWNRFLHPNWKLNKNSSAVQPVALSLHWLCYPGSWVVWTIHTDINEKPKRKTMIRVVPQIGGCQTEEDGMKVSGWEDKGEV